MKHLLLFCILISALGANAQTYKDAMLHNRKGDVASVSYNDKIVYFYMPDGKEGVVDGKNPAKYEYDVNGYPIKCTSGGSKEYIWKNGRLIRENRSFKTMFSHQTESYHVDYYYNQAGDRVKWVSVQGVFDKVGERTNIKHDHRGNAVEWDETYYEVDTRSKKICHKKTTHYKYPITYWSDLTGSSSAEPTATQKNTAPQTKPTQHTKHQTTSTASNASPYKARIDALRVEDRGDNYTVEYMLTHNDPKGMVIKYYVCDWQDTSLTPIKVGNSTVGRRKGFREYNSTHEAHSYTKTDLRNSPAHPGAF